MKYFFTLVVTFFCFSTFHAIADPNGKAGRLLNNVGCGDCHGNINAATTVTLTSKSGTFTIPVGGKLELTAAVAHSSKTRGGINVGVKDSPTSNTNVGTLEVITGQGLKKSGNELTQSTPKNMSAGKAEFSFNWIAPTKAGTYYILAVGNAVNGDGGQGGDNWNYMTPIAVTVTEATSVEEAKTLSGVTVFPNPYISNSTIAFSLEQSSNVEIFLYDTKGIALFTKDLGFLSAGDYKQVITDDCKHIPSGHYVLSIKNMNGMTSIPFIIQK